MISHINHSKIIASEKDEEKKWQLEVLSEFLTGKELDPDFVAFNSVNQRVHFPFRFYLQFRGIFAQVDPLFTRLSVRRSNSELNLASNISPNSLSHLGHILPIGLYQYSKNSPLLWVDPSGNDPCLTAALGGLGVGCLCSGAVSFLQWLLSDKSFVDVVQDCFCGGLGTALAAFVVCHFPTLQGGCAAGAAGTIANTVCTMIFDGIRKGGKEIKKDAWVALLSAPTDTLLGCLAGGMGEAATPKEKLTQALVGAVANVANKVYDALK
jgi:hypothetical protein